VRLRVLSYWDELSLPILAETVRDEWEVWIGSSDVVELPRSGEFDEGADSDREVPLDCGKSRRRTRESTLYVDGVVAGMPLKLSC
jgi:hypothetical protein